MTRLMWVLGIALCLVLGLVRAAHADYASTVDADLPTGYWRLNESAGPSIADIAGANAYHTAAHHATVLSDASLTYSQASLLDVGGGTAIKMLADQISTSVIRVPSHVDFDATNAITLEAWFKGTGYNSRFLGRSQGGSQYYLLGVDGGNPYVAIMASGTARSCVDTVHSILNNVRHHIVGTYDGTNMVVWLDGAKVKTCAHSPGGNISSQGTSNLGLGSAGDADAGAHGTLDELAIYLHVLDDGQIINHWALGASQNTPTVTGASAATNTPTATNTVANPTNTPTRTPTAPYRAPDGLSSQTGTGTACTVAMDGTVGDVVYAFIHLTNNANLITPPSTIVPWRKEVSCSEYFDVFSHRRDGTESPAKTATFTWQNTSQYNCIAVTYGNAQWPMPADEAATCAYSPSGTSHDGAVTVTGPSHVVLGGWQLYATMNGFPHWTAAPEMTELADAGSRGDLFGLELADLVRDAGSSTYTATSDVTDAAWVVLVPLAPLGQNTNTPTPTFTPIPVGGDYPTTVLADAPKGYWKLDDASGPTLVDASGFGHHATNLQTCSPTACFAFNQSTLLTGTGGGTAITFNPDYSNGLALLQVPAPCQPTPTPCTSDFDVTTAVTLEFWFKQGGYDNGLIGRENYYMGTNSGYPFMSLRIGAGFQTCASDTVAINDNVRHHVVGTYDGATVAIWVDGARQKTCALSPNGSVYSQAGKTFHFAGVSDVALGTRGTMDEVAFYNTVLSDARILAHWAVGSGTGAATPTNTSAVTSTPTRTPTRTNTPGGPSATPTPIGTVPGCGTSNVLICRGGPNHGSPCASDADCPAGLGEPAGICTRMGHQRYCEVTRHCSVTGGRCDDNQQCPNWPAEYCPGKDAGGPNYVDSHVPCSVSAATEETPAADCQPCKTPGVGGSNALAYCTGKCLNGASQANKERPERSEGSAGDEIADAVLGNCSMEDDQANAPTSAATGEVEGIAFDGTRSMLWIAEQPRVMGWDAAGYASSGGAASVVIGQQGFTHVLNMRIPGDPNVSGWNGLFTGRTLQLQNARRMLAVSTTDLDALFVTDGSRVLRYPRNTGSNPQADLVLGNIDTIGTPVGPLDASIGYATGMAAMRRCRAGTQLGATCSVDGDCPSGGTGGCATTLAIADLTRNRVMVWTTPPTSNGQAATLCLGQPDCFSTSANRGVSVAANGLWYPHGVAFDLNGNLYVHDSGNNRVVKYDRGFIQSSSAAACIGQPNCTSNTAGVGTQASPLLSTPNGGGLAIDRVAGGNEDLAVADFENHRVLIFAGPAASHVTGQSAQKVVGWTDFTTPQGGTIAANRLRFPTDVTFDAAHGLWIADKGNWRAVHLSSGFASTDATFDRVLGQQTTGAKHFYGVNGHSFAQGGQGGGIGVRAPTGPCCFGDQPNNRVLCWDDCSTARGERDADEVIGQASLTALSPSCTNPPSASSLCSPALLDSDASRVVVADKNNNRVLQYLRPLPATFGGAGVVFGQQGYFNTNGQPEPPSYNCTTGVNERTLCGPNSAKLDAFGNVWVADTIAGRVLLYCQGTGNLPNVNSLSGGYICTDANRDDDRADLVIGRLNFTTGAGGSQCTNPSASTLCQPWDVAIFGDDLRIAVSDRGTGGGRILIYNAPFGNGMGASAVLGVASGSMDSYTASAWPLCKDGLDDGKPCRYLEWEGWLAGQNSFRTCVGSSTEPEFICGTSDAACSSHGGGFCGCRSPGWCKWDASLARHYDRPVGTDDTIDFWLPGGLAFHPVRDALFVGAGGGAAMYRGPLVSGTDSTVLGATLPHQFWGRGTGYVASQWNYAGGGVALDTAGTLYQMQGAVEGLGGVYLALDPATNPTYTPTPDLGTSPTYTPLPTNTPAYTFTTLPTQTPTRTNTPIPTNTRSPTPAAGTPTITATKTRTPTIPPGGAPTSTPVPTFQGGGGGGGERPPQGAGSWNYDGASCHGPIDTRINGVLVQAGFCDNTSGYIEQQTELGPTFAGGTVQFVVTAAAMAESPAGIMRVGIQCACKRPGDAVDPAYSGVQLGTLALGGTQKYGLVRATINTICSGACADSPMVLWRMTVSQTDQPANTALLNVRLRVQE